MFDPAAHGFVVGRHAGPNDSLPRVTDTQPRPARILAVIVAAQFAGASIWFAGNAVLPALQRAWDLPAAAVGYVTSAVQLGFIAGTLVFAFLEIGGASCRERG